LKKSAGNNSGVAIGKKTWKGRLKKGGGKRKMNQKRTHPPDVPKEKKKDGKKRGEGQVGVWQVHDIKPGA